MTDLNPDGPHSPERTREAGQRFDDLSRLLCYATMERHGGLKFPADAYSLVADLYSATGRFGQICEQLGAFLGSAANTMNLYEARGGDPAEAVLRAEMHLAAAHAAAAELTSALQAVQTDIAGLGVREEDPPMAPEPDPLGAYLGQVHLELAAAAPAQGFGAVDPDWPTHLPRLLAAVEAVLKAADRWQENQGTPYSATRQCADELRRVLEEKLLSQEEAEDG